ncbi:MAG: carboxypeptidase regulatory-like domain-containing protein, partial [Dinghuibacter sp.]|nr:carboxypeptidase regulatory-like domain-containing protein [Dinghuibacter sp.]
LTVLCLFSQCKKNDQPGDDDNSPAPTGNITGRVVAANNTIPISLARVFIDSDGKVYHTQTDINGQFTLTAPAGLQQLNIQTGNGHMFRTTVNVTVKANETVTLPGTSVQLNQVANLAYIKGEYDKIEQLLIDTLGYAATEIHTYDFANINNIKQYNAIYINCSNHSVLQMNPQFDQVLAAYVANGGSLYTSDWAVNCLIGSVLYNQCPAARPGGFLPDSLLCTRRTGPSTIYPGSPVVSPTLMAYLNKPSITVSFNLGSWEQVNIAHPAFWEIMVNSPSGEPLFIRSDKYSDNSRGTVNIGSPGNNNWVTICHKPNGSNPVTLTIPQNALAAHLAHGDAIGPCGNNDGSGQIYYTTFHNAHNGLIGPDVKNILQYMILNL